MVASPIDRRERAEVGWRRWRCSTTLMRWAGPTGVAFRWNER